MTNTAYNSPKAAAITASAAASPLAPLSAARQNAYRAMKSIMSSPFMGYNSNCNSPAQVNAEKSGGKENVSPTPSKRMFHELDEYDVDEENDRHVVGLDGRDDDETAEAGSPCGTVRRRQNMVRSDAQQSPSPSRHGADDSLPSDPPSSPFQYDARNDTVDCQNLPQDQGPMSPRFVERTSLTSPVKKRSKKAEPSIEIHVDGDEHVDGTHDDEHSEESFNTAEDSMAVPENDPRVPDQSGSVHKENHESSIRNEVMSTMGDKGETHEASEIDNDTAFLEDHVSQSHDPMDDTCLSTFSAVPNVDMTAFAQIRGSPTKLVSPGRTGEHTAKIGTPSTVRRDPKTYERSPLASLTPRAQREPTQENDTTNLLDFTDQITYFTKVSQRYSSHSRTSGTPRRGSPIKSSRESIRSPGKYNLLDFDIPPAPTPRSIPTITPRELETLKSNFLSEISSLKATVSGKEAEVASLKQAVADAERRVGEALEEVRNEASRREAVEAEQAEWERRGSEMERVLRDVRAEIVEGERERERLTSRFEEAEKRKEQFEGRVVELESQLEAARKADASGPTVSESPSKATKTNEETAREVQDAVEKVARELHALYKGKHESKVAALKKSYEARWEKRVREAEKRLRDATEEIDRLKTERDATMSGPVNANASMIGLPRDSEELEAEKRVLEAKIKGLQQEIASMKRDNERLHSELKIERTEKGELVAAVDEWLAMQQIQNQQRRLSELPSVVATPQDDVEPEAAPKESDSENTSQIEPLKRSIGRSGIKPPSGSVATDKKSQVAGGSKLGLYGHSRVNSNGGGGAYRPSSALPTPGRSGIMSSIERMGRGGA